MAKLAFFSEDKDVSDDVFRTVSFDSFGVELSRFVKPKACRKHLHKRLSKHFFYLYSSISAWFIQRQTLTRNRLIPCLYGFSFLPSFNIVSKFVNFFGDIGHELMQLVGGIICFFIHFRYFVCVCRNVFAAFMPSETQSYSFYLPWFKQRVLGRKLIFPLMWGNILFAWSSGHRVFNLLLLVTFWEHAG